MFTSNRGSICRSHYELYYAAAALRRPRRLPRRGWLCTYLRCFFALQLLVWIGLWKIEVAISISSSFAPPLPAAKRREDNAKVYNANEAMNWHCILALILYSHTFSSKIKISLIWRARAKYEFVFMISLYSLYFLIPCSHVLTSIWFGATLWH